MTSHHVAALGIAAAMVCACAYLFLKYGGQHGDGVNMFFGVVQLANTIASGIAGMALGPMLKRSKKHGNGDLPGPHDSGRVK